MVLVTKTACYSTSPEDRSLTKAGKQHQDIQVYQPNYTKTGRHFDVGTNLVLQRAEKYLLLMSGLVKESPSRLAALDCTFGDLQVDRVAACRVLHTSTNLT